MNFGTNSQYQLLMDSTGKYNPLAKEFREIARKLSSNAVKIWIELIHCETMPSQYYLEKCLNLSRKTIRAALKELVQYSLLIAKETLKKSKNKFALNLKRENWGKKLPDKEEQSRGKSPPDFQNLGENLPQNDENLGENLPQSAAHSLLLKKKNKILLKKEGMPPFEEGPSTYEQRELPLKTLIHCNNESKKTIVRVSDGACSSEQISNYFKDFYEQDNHYGPDRGRDRAQTFSTR